MDNDSGSEHSSWDDSDRGWGDWQDQFDSFEERVADHNDMSVEEFRESSMYDDFLDAYSSAFGEDVGDLHFGGVDFDDPKEYAEFLADYLDYDHDEIDEALGYGDEAN